MAGLIPKNFITELLARVDVVALIGARLSLRKAGGSFVTCCPFHQEKTPSFNINPRKQFYYCFGCGKTGNAISFLMDYEHLTFVEAVSTLADDLGLTIPWEGGHKQAPKQDYEPLYRVLEQVANYYQAQLKSSQAAQNYLKKRQLSTAVIERFRLGFAPPQDGTTCYGTSTPLMPSTKPGCSVLKKAATTITIAFAIGLCFPFKTFKAASSALAAGY